MAPRIAQLWDGANQWWQERVVEFDLRSQLDLLRKLGIDSPDWQPSRLGIRRGPDACGSRG